MAGISTVSDQAQGLFRHTDRPVQAAKATKTAAIDLAAKSADGQGGTTFKAESLAAPVTMTGYGLTEKPEEAKTMFTSQKTGQEEEYDEGTVLREFMDFMKKTPVERWYEQFLKEEGLTKEELEALPPEERAKIEARIQEKMETRMKQSLGVENGEQAGTGPAQTTGPAF